MVDVTDDEKIKHATEWLEKQLRSGDGPKSGRHAILLVRVEPRDDGTYFTSVCLPDMDHQILYDGVLSFAESLKEGAFDWSPSDMDKAQITGPTTKQ